MSSPQFEQIRYELRDGIATITLDRPEQMNMVTTRMVGELHAAVDLAESDDDVRVIVLTGAGRMFCAGADLAREGTDGGGAFSFEDPTRHRDTAGDFSIRLFECTRPVIAAVNGAAVGMGATMILPADIRIASTTAKFGYVFTRRGITPDGAATWFLPRAVGVNQAMEWMATGRIFDADEALRAGLVKSLHEPDDLMHSAYTLAREIADNTSPVCVALTRQMTWRMLGAPHPRDAHELESRSLGVVGCAADVQEGIASFKEKRQPQFPGTISKDMPDFYPWWPAREFSPLP
jgi:enoyl-CoA hydratase/carnithine racemase